MPAAPPDQNPLDGVPASELVADLEAQLGRMAGELAAMQIRLRRRDQALQDRDDEIRYLKSLQQPPVADSNPEG